MNAQAVLVLGNHASRDLPEVIRSIGFVPQLWGSVQHSLDKLRHGRFAAVCVDRKRTRADVLEFILNVRDIDAAVPVVVIGSDADERIDRKIMRQDRTVVLPKIKNRDELAEELAHAIKKNTTADV
jgi:FixJ family two-component response regulator